jgi:uncharacterized protein Usg
MPSSLLRQLSGYGLTTAHILYRLPDHPVFLQSYLWQDYDLAPDFPELHRFLDFWKRELDGPAAFGAGGASRPDRTGRVPDRGGGIRPELELRAA